MPARQALPAVRWTTERLPFSAKVPTRYTPLVALPWRPRVVLTSADSEVATPSEVRASGAEAFVPKDELLNAALDDLLGYRAG